MPRGRPPGTRTPSKLDPSRYTLEYCESQLGLDPHGCDRIYGQVQKDLEILKGKRRPRRRWKAAPKVKEVAV